MRPTLRLMVGPEPLLSEAKRNGRRWFRCRPLPRGPPPRRSQAQARCGGAGRNMIDESTFAALINAIYDAAVDWGAWPDALRLISSACASHTTVLTRQGASPEESWSLAPQCDPAYYKSYCSYYHGVNPLRQRAASAPAGTIQTDAIIMPKSELVRTEFYNDFLAPQRLGSMLRPQRRAAVAKVFSRPPLRPTIPISVGRQGGQCPGGPCRVRKR
jgi:hypothetical protein